MKSTRDKILNSLLLRHHATISDLSAIVGINGISVRHHLINLQAEGLIISEEERHGVGRPRYTYRLTQKGFEKFPTNYLRLSDQLLSTLEQKLEEEQLTEIFDHIGKDLAAEHYVDCQSLSLDQQLDDLSEQLASDGFRITWKMEDNQVYMYSLNCPYHNIGLSHPQICRIDQTMFSTILQREVLPTTCMLKGDEDCSYLIKA